LNFALFDRHDENYVHAIVRMTNLEGVRKIHVRTGPHSLSVNHGENKQHALWGYGVVPELEIEMYPRSGNNKLLEAVKTDIIFFINRCALDTTDDCETFADDLLLGIENKFTTQMVMHPMKAINHQVHKSLEGETALHLRVDNITPGNNRFYLTRAGNSVVAVFNNAQGDATNVNYTLNAWTFILIVMLIIALGAILVYAVLITVALSQIKKEMKANDTTMIALQESLSQKMVALEAVILTGSGGGSDTDTTPTESKRGMETGYGTNGTAGYGSYRTESLDQPNVLIKRNNKATR